MNHLSTLAHHLRFLAAAGLVLQEKRGREVISQANVQRIESLADYLLEECCQESRAELEHHQNNLINQEEVHG